jgi:arylsulfatase A-like enzyme
MHRWLALLGLAACLLARQTGAAERPNILLVITDDQGYGDLGAHGNPLIHTPALDQLAGESVELTHFYVSPVCAPTRASLLTGRYNYRTGVTDTYHGRAMMRAAEVTLAEHLASAGYATGIFGKWHLGDNYPLRPMDQGFQTSLVHRGGGIGQASDARDGRSYFDPILFRNGQLEKQQGYVSDVITREAERFIAQHATGAEPWFCYLAFNAPHVPLEVPDADRQRYANIDPAAQPQIGNPPDKKLAADVLARVYGMVTNIDDNVGRLLSRLDQLGARENTVVIFMTDNGPQQARYVGGLKGRKGTVYEGGIRVPCLVRWPGTLAPRKVDSVAAHIDLTPTLLEFADCRPQAPFDGVSLAPLLQGAATDLPQRTLFFQWHRGDTPERYRGFAARSNEWKLLRLDPGRDDAPALPEQFELYRIADDPYELHNVTASEPEIVAALKQQYDAWLDDVGAEHRYAPVRPVLGTPHENPATLTPQDWRAGDRKWTRDTIGQWEVEFGLAGDYQVTVELPRHVSGTVALHVGAAHQELPIEDAETARFTLAPIAAGPAAIRAVAVVNGDEVGPDRIIVERIGPPPGGRL